jgi:uncharacterized protein (UPF0335 family)
MKLSEDMKSYLEYVENTGMSNIPKNDIQLYISKVEKLEKEIDYLKKLNKVLTDECNIYANNDIKLYIHRAEELEKENEELKEKLNEYLGNIIQKILSENKQLKEKLNKYLHMACESKKSCNCECHNCEIDSDSESLENSGVTG